MYRALLLFTFLIIALAGCHGAPVTSDALAIRVPVGVVQPPAGLLAGSYYRGMWITSSGDDSCCWIGPSAHISVHKPWVSHRMVIVFYVPTPGLPDEANPHADPVAYKEWLFFNTHRFDASVQFSNGPKQTRCCFGSGYHSIEVRLPEQYDRFVGRIDFQLGTTRSFIPAVVGFGSDERRLGLMVVRVFFERDSTQNA